MIPLSVSKISALDGFCDEDEQDEDEDEEELGILVVRYCKWQFVICCSAIMCQCHCQSKRKYMYVGINAQQYIFWH